MFRSAACRVTADFPTRVTTNGSLVWNSVVRLGGHGAPIFNRRTVSNRNNVFRPSPLINSLNRSHYGKGGRKQAVRSWRSESSGAIWGSIDMGINEFAHLSRAKLLERLRQLTRSEQDMDERLMARERQARESGED